MRLPLRASGRGLLFLLILLVILYTIIFRSLMRYDEGKEVSYIDALFWTVSTITTTGEGFQRLAYATPALQFLSMAVQLTGLAVIFAAFPLVVIPWLRRTFFQITPTEAPEKLKDHVIVIGYNALVEAFTRELRTVKVPFLIVEKDREKAEDLFKSGMPVIYGNAEEEKVLQNAGINRAKLVITNEGDEENASIVLAIASTRDMEIIGLVEDVSNAKYLKYAGASIVLSPKSLAGSYIARKVMEHLGDKIVGPVKFHGNLRIVDLPLEKGAPMKAKNLGDLNRHATIAALRDKEGLNLEPDVEYVPRGGDIITAIGSTAELNELKEVLGMKASPGHAVVLGYGDVGAKVVEMFRDRGVDFLVVDKEVSRFTQAVYKHVIGDGTSEKTLIEAGIEKASALVTVMGEDMLNIYATLLARKLNPGVTIFAKVNYARSIDKAYKAGANFVVSLSLVGGETLAKMIVAPEEYKKYHQDTLTLPEGIKLYKYLITRGSPAVGKTLKQIKASEVGCKVLLLEKEGRTIMNPSDEEILEEGSTAIILGSPDAVEEFRKKFPD